MSRQDDVVTVEINRIVHETDNAILIEASDTREIWLPFSTVEAIDHTDPPKITLQRWLAEKEGLV